MQTKAELAAAAQLAMGYLEGPRAETDGGDLARTTLQLVQDNQTLREMLFNEGRWPDLVEREKRRTCKNIQAVTAEWERTGTTPTIGSVMPGVTQTYTETAQGNHRRTGKDRVSLWWTKAK